ncbi:MAG TPA: hypothetical protein PK379_13910 [Candidatus Hydrogenedentes bacterium]|nr:hypothetical protein [Candidatus Hydrogenedentota bacterium]
MIQWRTRGPALVGYFRDATGKRGVIVSTGETPPLEGGVLFAIPSNTGEMESVVLEEAARHLSPDVIFEAIIVVERFYGKRLAKLPPSLWPEPEGTKHA